ncbi:MAG TPA: hypothetical protein PLS81_02465 [Deltaproteobacteria bacterium]|nr:hypothetical protein [Deltaproteobacteria bacterium]HOM28304.1 hypothetical protein [Deltaproteobacteria bacterium]
MTREEFERTLVDFETKIKKRLPSVIGAYLANKGNREFEASFTHLVDTLDRQRKTLLRDLPKVARLDQRTRYFNAVSALDAQLRSMANKDALKEKLRLRQRRVHEPVIYDLGEGPRAGLLLNAEGTGVVLETEEKIPPECEVSIELAGRKARGKAMWSIPEESGRAETGVRLASPPDEFVAEINRIISSLEGGPKGCVD